MIPPGTISKPVDEPVTRAWEKIALVADISAACRRMQPRAPNFDEVLELLQHIIPFDAATLMLKSRADGSYKSMAQIGMPVPLPTDPDLDCQPTDTVGPAPILKEPTIFALDTFENQDEDSQSEFGELMIVPLWIDDGLIGFLNLGACFPGLFVEAQLKLMSIVADHLAVSIDRLGRLAEIEARNVSLQQAQRRLRAQQDRLVAAEKLTAITDLAASVNHQINNPLAVIVGQIQCLLIQDQTLDTRSRERLERVEQAALRIAEVNRRLLSIDSICAPDETAETITSLQDEL